MDAKARIKKEKTVIPLLAQGYMRRTASCWFGMMMEDSELHGSEFEPEFLDFWHKRGYLSSSIRRWNLTEKKKVSYISDFEYLCLSPLNNSFSKWLEDMLTTQRILFTSEGHFRDIYFSIIQREDRQLILHTGKEDREYTAEDILDLVCEKKKVELRPARWNSESRNYILSCDESQNGPIYLCNNETITPGDLGRIIAGLDCSYIVTDPVTRSNVISGIEAGNTLELWVSNDEENKSKILAAEIHFSDTDNGKGSISSPVNLQRGTFKYSKETFRIPGWDDLKEDIIKDAEKISQICFYSTTISLKPDGSFVYLSFSENPALPQCRFSKEFNDFLKYKLDIRFHKRNLFEELEAIWYKFGSIEEKIACRNGMRPYMYGLWKETARNDLLHTRGIPLSQKVWAHRHGFFSWRIPQYGLTKENYKQFLSDYDYYWLNRINNEYQVWVNDKTTFRYTMEPFKELIPKYFFSIFKRDGEVRISKMPDCPPDIPNGVKGILEILKREGKLAVKASAGTHGDGFYCLAYENGTILVNGEPYGEDDIELLIEEMNSFYVVTEYVEMHRDIKKIYDKSVNTVRMMVVNDHGFDPRIMQTYMRIGSSKTGYTDNVGYGGICVFVDKNTGELYQAETIKDHVFYDSPIHPDTGTPISGALPNWDFIRSKVLEICRYFCELEYLGFDIAITEDGFKILEINIHQDLHKVASFDEDIKEFFHRKLEDKNRLLKKTRNISYDGVKV